MSGLENSATLFVVDASKLEAEYRDAATDAEAEAEALDWIEWAPDEALDLTVRSYGKSLPERHSGLMRFWFGPARSPDSRVASDSRRDVATALAAFRAPLVYSAPIWPATGHRVADSDN